jgi:hypothetical protein
VNKKKCPKCGEENPAEAVMCWACYTPLAGAAPIGTAGAAPTGAVKGAAPVVGEEAGEKPKIPPWQMGIVGVGLLAALYFGVRAVMPSSASDDDSGDTTTQTTTDRPPDAGGNPGAPAPSPSNPVVISSSGTAQVMPDKAPFTIAVPPNPKLSVATMAIVPTDAATSGPGAAALAAYTRRQYTARIDSWNTLYIYVFSDAQSAQYFADYQKHRKGAPLGPSDYSYLANLWGSCLARYEYSTAGGGKHVERVLYPSKNPSGWWYSRNGIS